MEEGTSQTLCNISKHKPTWGADCRKLCSIMGIMVLPSLSCCKDGGNVVSPGKMKRLGLSEKSISCSLGLYQCNVERADSVLHDSNGRLSGKPVRSAVTDEFMKAGNFSRLQFLRINLLRDGRVLNVSWWILMLVWSDISTVSSKFIFSTWMVSSPEMIQTKCNINLTTVTIPMPWLT